MRSLREFCFSGGFYDLRQMQRLIACHSKLTTTEKSAPLPPPSKPKGVTRNIKVLGSFGLVLEKKRDRRIACQTSRNKLVYKQIGVQRVVMI